MVNTDVSGDEDDDCHDDNDDNIGGDDSSSDHDNFDMVKTSVSGGGDDVHGHNEEL